MKRLVKFIFDRFLGKYIKLNINFDDFYKGLNLKNV